MSESTSQRSSEGANPEHAGGMEVEQQRVLHGRDSESGSGDQGTDGEDMPATV